MPMQIRYDFFISDLLLRVESPRQLYIPDNFKPFYSDMSPNRAPDILFQIVFDTASTTSGEDVRPLLTDNSHSDLPFLDKFPWENGEFIVRQASAGRGAPCRLFIPPGYADIFCQCGGNWLAYFALERMLLPYDRFFLHSSAVIYQGKAYLFSAPSGGGKSTHAALWQKHYDAVLLNGDKVLIHTERDGCMAYGSPVAGSSGIYKNIGAPIAAVFLLKKGAENRLTSLSKRTGLLSLYSEAIKSHHDPMFNHQLLDLLEKMQTCVPIFSLECLPEESAVQYVLQNYERITP